MQKYYVVGYGDTTSNKFYAIYDRGDKSIEVISDGNLAMCLNMLNIPIVRGTRLADDWSYPEFGLEEDDFLVSLTRMGNLKRHLKFDSDIVKLQDGREILVVTGITAVADSLFDIDLKFFELGSNNIVPLGGYIFDTGFWSNQLAQNVSIQDIKLYHTLDNVQYIGDLGCISVSFALSLVSKLEKLKVLGYYLVPYNINRLHDRANGHGKDFGASLFEVVNKTDKTISVSPFEELNRLSRSRMNWYISGKYLCIDFFRGEKVLLEVVDR